jgi:hypothetical protein
MIPMGQTTGQLPILAADSLAPGPVLFGIEGKATIAGKEVRSQASIRTVLSHGLANLPVPPRPWYHQLAMGVTERVPFTLTAKLEMPTATPGKPATLTVTATRIPGFIEELAVSVTDLPAHVTATSLTIPAGQNQGQIKLMVGDKAAVGNIPITLGAKVRYKNRDYAVTTKVALEIKK